MIVAYRTHLEDRPYFSCPLSCHPEVFPIEERAAEVWWRHYPRFLEKWTIKKQIGWQHIECVLLFLFISGVEILIAVWKISVLCFRSSRWPSLPHKFSVGEININNVKKINKWKNKKKNKMWKKPELLKVVAKISNFHRNSVFWASTYLVYVSFQSRKRVSLYLVNRIVGVLYNVSLVSHKRSCFQSVQFAWRCHISACQSRVERIPSILLIK